MNKTLLVDYYLYGYFKEKPEEILIPSIKEFQLKYNLIPTTLGLNIKHESLNEELLREFKDSIKLEFNKIFLDRIVYLGIEKKDFSRLENVRLNLNNIS